MDIKLVIYSYINAVLNESLLFPPPENKKKYLSQREIRQGNNINLAPLSFFLGVRAGMTKVIKNDLKILAHNKDLSHLFHPWQR
jgi:hypothetical protein